MHFDSLQAFGLYMMRKANKQYESNIRSMLNDIGKATARCARQKIGVLQPPVGPYPGWPALADATVLRKQRYGLGKGGNPESPLYSTGAFSKSIRYKVDAGRGSVTIGTHLAYIVFTEMGTAHQPPRPVFGPAAHQIVPKFLPAIASSVAASMIGARSLQYSVFAGGGDS